MDSRNVTRFPMTQGEVIRLNRPQGWAIKAHTGRIWITQTNQSEDIFLDAGNVFVAQDGGVLIAEAMNNALVSLTGPKAAVVADRSIGEAFGLAPGGV